MMDGDRNKPSFGNFFSMLVEPGLKN